MLHRPDPTEGEKVESDLSHARPDRDDQLHPLGQPRSHLRQEGGERVRLVGLVHLPGAESVDEDEVVAVLEEPPLVPQLLQRLHDGLEEGARRVEGAALGREEAGQVDPGAEELLVGEAGAAGADDLLGDAVDEVGHDAARLVGDVGEVARHYAAGYVSARCGHWG